MRETNLGGVSYVYQSRNNTCFVVSTGRSIYFDTSDSAMYLVGSSGF